MTQNGDFSIFDNEEKVIRQAEELAISFDKHAKLVHENMKSLAVGYRRSFREQQRLIRLSDRQQEQLRSMTAELQDANERLAQLNSALQEEIKQKKLLEDELRAIATIDSLTEVYTRRQLLEFGENEFKRFSRTTHPLVILMVDIDHFKNINDTYGHAVGDNALKRFTAICKESIRAVDILGRVGGEEFVVIMPETDEKEAREVADRIRRNVADSELCIEDLCLSFAITVSIGLYSVDREDGSFEQAMSKADSALYEAKREGRNRVVIYKKGS
jgi:diguanylate cyclase (GGDEF)-like protein